MKVNVSGYGLLPFRATECYKFRGDESLVQFRGEVKLPKGSKTGGGKKWIQHNYWYRPTEIGVTYGTSPSEADAEKFREAIAAFDTSLLDSYFTAACDGKACTKDNCTCKKVDGLYRPTGLGESGANTNSSGPANKSVDIKDKEFKGTNFRTVFTSEKPSDMSYSEWLESLAEEYDGLTRIRVSNDSEDTASDSDDYDTNVISNTPNTIPAYTLIGIQIYKLIKSLDSYDILDPTELNVYKSVIDTIKVLQQLRQSI